MKTPIRLVHFVLFVLVVSSTSGCLTASGPSSWNFRVLYQENLQGMPAVPVGGTGIYGYHMWNNPGTIVGSATSVSGTTNSSGYVYSQDGRVPARWHLVVSSGHCQGQWVETNIIKDETIGALCTIVRSDFYSTDSYGYIADWIPSEYWDIEPGLEDPPAAGAPGTLTGDQYLYVNDAVYSPNGQFRLEYQGDGNLVLYDGGTPLWATDTNDNNPGWTAMQGDGNFVVYNGNSQPVWESGTAGEYGAYLAVMDNGTLILFSSGGTPLWWSNSGY